MQSLDPSHLARAIGTPYGFWPLDYDLTRAQWEQREADAAGIARIRFTTLHASKGPGPSAVVSYSRDLIRLAFLPKKLRTQVVEEVARIVEADINLEKLPAPPAWRRRRQGRAPVYQWVRPKRTEGGLARDPWPTVPRRFFLIARMDAYGYTTAEIVREADELFGEQWPGQHETYDSLPEKERRVRLRKLHKDTVLRDVRKARRERARMAQQTT